MLHTVTGRLDQEQAGTMLPHEHIMVGFYDDATLTPDDYDNEEVIAAILPLLQKLKDSGCSTIVDCAPEYLGRDALLLRELSLRSGVHIVTNTGLYKSPFLPSYAYEEDERTLAKRWIREAVDGIGDTGVYPGFIKIALNEDEAINEVQQKILHAAMRTSMETGLVIQCHTIGASIGTHAMEIMNGAGFELDRFIWVHAHSCEDLSVLQRAAAMGMWISIDGIMPEAYDWNIELLKQLLVLGAGDRILLSQDTGWYNVGQPNGGAIHPYHRLFTDFMPLAAAQGIPADWLNRCAAAHAYTAMKLRK